METKTIHCKNCSKDFIVDTDDQAFYEKANVPLPTHCPRCRRLRRLAWFNDYILYSRDCFQCGTHFISIYATNNAEKVLCPKCFHGDGWNPEEYGQKYDPSRSFFDQFNDLFVSIPKLGVVNDDGIGSVGCLYTNDLAFSKKCTMCFVCWRMENCMYSLYINTAKDICDCHEVTELCEFTYEGVMIDSVVRSKYIYWSSSCTDCMFVYDLRGCSDCFMCFGLRNKKYYFQNKQYSKEEYEAIVASYQLNTRTGNTKAKKEFGDFIRKYPRKFAELRNSVKCTGTDIIRGKNTRDANFASFSEDSRYCHNGVTFKSCYDCAGGGETELAYECITPDQSYASLVTIKSWKNRNVSYSIDCHSSEELFGCTGIKSGKYVILNKRYEKEEYFKLKEKIISDMKERGEWGEFFPTKNSPFCINESRAIEQLGIIKEEAIVFGYRWQEALQETRGKQTLVQELVPDSIDDVSETIVSEVLECRTCTRNYKILPDELILYKRLKVPVPESCFFCRVAVREAMRGGFDLSMRRCECIQQHSDHIARCPNTFETFFTEKEERPIYCESCYVAEFI